MNINLGSLVSLFTEKGGTMRLGLCFAFLYSIMEFGYGIRISDQDGASFGQNLPFSSETEDGQDKRLPHSSTDSNFTE